MPTTSRHARQHQVCERSGGGRTTSGATRHAEARRPPAAAVARLARTSLDQRGALANRPATDNNNKTTTRRRARAAQCLASASRALSPATVETAHPPPPAYSPHLIRVARVARSPMAMATRASPADRLSSTLTLRDTIFDTLEDTSTTRLLVCSFSRACARIAARNFAAAHNQSAGCMAIVVE